MIACANIRNIRLQQVHELTEHNLNWYKARIKSIAMAYNIILLNVNVQLVSIVIPFLIIDKENA